jgi:membrane protein implicated in regulation of membrane protease activity
LSAVRWISIIVGVLLLLAGIVFALQGANIIGGSAIMSGDPTYIYVGVVVAVVGMLLVAIGARMRDTKQPNPSSGNPQSSMP